MLLQTYRCDEDGCDSSQTIMEGEGGLSEGEGGLSEGFRVPEGWIVRNAGSARGAKHRCRACVRMPPEVRAAWEAADVVRDAAADVERLGFVFEECVNEDHGEDCEFHVYPDDSNPCDPKLYVKVLFDGCGARKLLVYRGEELLVDWYQQP